MKREEIADLMAFVVVAEERSFTRDSSSSPPEHGAVSFKPDSAPYRRTIGIAASDPNHAQCCTH